MKCVSPFRPFVAESAAHRKLGPFDWVGALEMLRVSVRQSCHCETYAITDVDTALPGPTHAYVTTHRRLMVWILDVSLAYLDSADFDQDTVMLSPDLLVYRDLAPWFTADLGVLVRSDEKHRRRPLLNAVQFWRHDAKDRLVAFYREVLAVAPTLPENCLRWGADTEALVAVLQPISLGLESRGGLTVQFIESVDVLKSLSDRDMARVRYGQRPEQPRVPISDFKMFRRKKLMAAYFAATIGGAAA